MRRPGYSLLGELVLLNREARKDAIATREFGAATDLLAESMIVEEAVLHVTHLRRVLGEVLVTVKCPSVRVKLTHVDRGLAALAS
jgi:hypothetical protein